MVEPITAAVGAVSSIVKSAEAIDKLLANHAQLAKDDAKYYGTYIEVASQAIKGIEGEYLEILIQAAQLNLNDEEERKALQKRIANYINGEVLRPKLRDSIDRLREGKNALDQHAEQLLIWPTVTKKRKAALAKFDKLLNDLDSYLGSLGGYVGESAVALRDIKKIQEQLSAVPGDPATFADMIGEFLMNLDKSVLMANVGECARVVETLRIAFR